MCNVPYFLFAKKICFLFQWRWKKCQSLNLIDSFCTNQMNRCKLVSLGLSLNCYYIFSRFPPTLAINESDFLFKYRFCICESDMFTLSLSITIVSCHFHWNVVIAHIHNFSQTQQLLNDVFENVKWIQKPWIFMKWWAFCYCLSMLLTFHERHLIVYKNQDILLCIFCWWSFFMAICVDSLTKWAKAKWKFDRIWCEHFPIKNSMHLNKTHRIYTAYNTHHDDDAWINDCLLFYRFVHFIPELSTVVDSFWNSTKSSLFFYTTKWHFIILRFAKIPILRTKTTEKLCELMKKSLCKSVMFCGFGNFTWRMQMRLQIHISVCRLFLQFFCLF